MDEEEDGSPTPDEGPQKPLKFKRPSPEELRRHFRRIAAERHSRDQEKAAAAAAAAAASTAAGEEAAEAAMPGSGSPPDDGPPGPYPFGLAGDSEPPGDKLAAFMVAVHDDLHKTVLLKDALFSSQDPDLAVTNAYLLVAMEAAWAEVDQTFRDQDLLGQVLAADIDLLAAHGLTGWQLDFKLLAWHLNRELLRAAFADSDDPDPGQAAEPEPVLPPDTPSRFRRLRATVPRALRNGLRHLGRTFANADIVLGSLAAALPGVSAGVGLLSEFKETVEGLAKDRADETGA